MSSSYNNIPCSKHKLVVSIYSNTETSLAMSTLAIVVPRCQVSRFQRPGAVAYRSDMMGLVLV